MNETINEILIKEGIFEQKKTTTFSCGIESDSVYVDCRNFFSDAIYREIIIQDLKEIVLQLESRYIAGVDSGGSRWAACVAQEVGYDSIFIRKEEKSHGIIKGFIEGKLKKGEKYILIEDVITTGSGALRAYDIITKESGIVTDCVSIFSYLKDEMIEKFKGYDINLQSLTCLDEVIKTAKNKEKIDPIKEAEITNLRNRLLKIR